MKVWEQGGIELGTPGSAVRLAYVARHTTDCAMWPGIYKHDKHTRPESLKHKKSLFFGILVLLRK